LGVGTQLALTVGTAITRGQLSAEEVARLAGRGQRSAIGINGFARGGLLIDAGKRQPDEIGHIVIREDVPGWHVVLVTPRLETGWFGQKERNAFDQLASSVKSNESLYRIALTGIVPALQTADLRAFGVAVTELNARAGEMFAAVQGGRYSHSVIAEIVNKLLGLGFAGAGQSSWGPTVFGFTDDPQRFDFARQQIQLPIECEWILTTPRNTGATIS
jgi:beta-RFAP synthase